MQWTKRKVKALTRRLDITMAELSKLMGVKYAVFYNIIHLRVNPVMPEKYWPSLDALAKWKGPDRWTPEQMKELRATMEWSQAKACEMTGICPTGWSEMETGRRPIRLVDRLKLDKTKAARMAREMLS